MENQGMPRGLLVVIGLIILCPVVIVPAGVVLAAPKNPSELLSNTQAVIIKPPPPLTIEQSFGLCVNCHGPNAEGNKKQQRTTAMWTRQRLLAQSIACI